MNIGRSLNDSVWAIKGNGIDLNGIDTWKLEVNN